MILPAVAARCRLPLGWFLTQEAWNVDRKTMSGVEFKFCKAELVRQWLLQEWLVGDSDCQSWPNGTKASRSSHSLVLEEIACGFQQRNLHSKEV